MHSISAQTEFLYLILYLGQDIGTSNTKRCAQGLAGFSAESIVRTDHEESDRISPRLFKDAVDAASQALASNPLKSVL